MPADKPLVIPLPFTVAMEGEAELHDPPEAPSVKAMVLPTHTDVAPEMAPADEPALTDIGAVVVAVPQLLVTL